jgi:N-acetylmuramidase/Putative peptidoglycan binding domain
MITIRRGLAPIREATTLQVFLVACGHSLNPDGQFGASTEAALKDFQRQHGLVVDGVAGEKTWVALFALQPQLLQRMAQQWLSQADIEGFAQRHGLAVPVVRAVYGVESGGLGFIGTQPKILFEGHVFWRELVAAGIDPQHHLPANRDILFKTWNPKSYAGGLAEHARLQRAMAIAAAPAQRAASWGLFQILGLHAESLGFANVGAFVAAMQTNEAAHLDAFGGFITVNRFRGKALTEHLRTKNWAAFAEGYNGPGYKRNAYDDKLAAACARYEAQS